MNTAEMFINKPIYNFDLMMDEISKKAVSISDGDCYAYYIYEFEDGSQIECGLIDHSLAIGDLFRPFIKNKITTGLRKDWNIFNKVFL